MDNVTITEPLSYADFARAMDRCSLVLTDSGGVQEEAPSLGKPVLVLRETTERPEAVDAGTVRLVGTDEDLVVTEVAPAADRPDGVRRRWRTRVNPYGDGQATPRIVAAIEDLLGLGTRLPDWGHRAGRRADFCRRRPAPGSVTPYPIWGAADPRLGTFRSAPARRAARTGYRPLAPARHPLPVRSLFRVTNPPAVAPARPKSHGTPGPTRRRASAPPRVAVAAVAAVALIAPLVADAVTGSRDHGPDGAKARRSLVSVKLQIPTQVSSQSPVDTVVSLRWDRVLPMGPRRRARRRRAGRPPQCGRAGSSRARST